MRREGWVAATDVVHLHQIYPCIIAHEWPLHLPYCCLDTGRAWTCRKPVPRIHWWPVGTRWTGNSRPSKGTLLFTRCREEGGGAGAAHQVHRVVWRLQAYCIVICARCLRLPAMRRVPNNKKPDMQASFTSVRSIPHTITITVHGIQHGMPDADSSFNEAR